MSENDNKVGQQIGGKIWLLQNISLRFGIRIMLNNFLYEFCKGDHICLAGANGVRKTTVTKLLMGELLPDHG